MKKQVQKAVKKTFEKSPKTVNKIDEGLIHETYTVEVNGDNFILQFSGKDEENHSALSQCLKMYELLQGTVPVPETVTKEVQEIDGRNFTVVKNVDGVSGEQNISPQKTREAGKTLAKIHGFTEFEEEGWIKFNGGKNPQELLDNLEIIEFREKNLKRKKLSELEEKIETFSKKGLEDVAEETRKFIEEHGDFFPEEYTPVLIHDDFTPDNIIYRKERLNGVIDLDYAFSGLEVRNIVKSANSFWMHDPGAERNIRNNFYEGYSEERSLPEDFDNLENFFRIETLVHLIGGLIELGELDKEEKDFYREEILEEVSKSKEKLAK